MNFGAQEQADQQRRGPGDQDASESTGSHAATAISAAALTRRRLERPADQLEPDPARGLDEHHVAGREQLGQQRGGLRRRRRPRYASPSNRRPSPAASGPTVTAGRPRRRPRDAPISSVEARARRARARACRRAPRRARVPCRARRSRRGRRGRRASTSGWRCSSRRSASRRRAAPTRCPRPGESASSTRPPAITPTARAAATAASRLRRRWACVNGTSSSIGSPPMVDLDAARRRRERSRTSPPSPNVTVSRSSRRWGSSSGSPAGITAVAPGRQPGDQLGLGRGDRLDGAEQLEVHRPDADDHADVGLGDRGQLGDLAGAAHRHLEHQHLGARRRAEDLQRQADLGVEVRARGDRAAVRREQREQQVLGRGLAGRAGDADHRRAELAPPGASPGAAAPSAGRRRPAPRPRGPRLAASACSGVVSTPHAPAASACGGEPTAVGAGSPAGRRTARRGRPRASRSSRARARRRPVAARAAARRPRRAISLGRSRLSSGAAPRPRAPRAPRSRRRTGPCGRLELLALLVPLAGDHDHVARLGSGDRLGDRLAAVDVCARRRGPAPTRISLDDRLGVLGARVVGGDDHPVGQPPGDLAHQRPLAAVAVAAAAEHHVQPAVGERRAAAASTFSSESGVCA